MTNETVSSFKGCTLRLGLDSLQELSFETKDSSSPLPPVICVPYRGQMQGIPWPLFFSSFPGFGLFGWFCLFACFFLLFFFSARPVPWLGLLCSFTNTSTSTRLGPARAVDGDSLNPVENSLGWRALSPRKACSNLVRKTIYGLYFQVYLRHLEIQD